ncbi:growth factor receptor-bound protein 14-like isoform X2 [Diorhabda sublineata]|uniref:growth factor receptor-bound protein 14-like isoform X2 n=1 Tax=Diorhabda sublineata TaxID=1163346 RepID=UPI0024E142C9|nr:growth factor receptor-bound protein 14-like isoform X2 [Diorhabda sublineata]
MLQFGKKHDPLSEWCRYPRGKCTCTRGVGYSRLQEVVEESFRDVQYEDLPSTSQDQSEELAFFNDNESFQLVVVERNLCASDLCQLLALKNRLSKSVHWSIVEQWNDLGLERLVEDHEYVLAAYRDMKRFSYHARFKFRFRKDFRKYEFFHHPQQFFPNGMLNIDNDPTDEQKTVSPIPTHLQHMVIQEGLCPVIFSHVWIRDERKKNWVKMYMTLRDQMLFISQKIQSLAKFMRTPKNQAIELILEDRKFSSDVEVYADIRKFHAYTTLNAKNQFRAPTEWGIVLRPTTLSTDKTAENNDEDVAAAASTPFPITSSDQLHCLACDSERVRSCWVIAMRLAKYGKQLRENYRAFRNKQGDSINSKDYNSYSVPNESVRSRVAMDFTGAVGRIVEDPQEATAIAVAEGYSWKRRWRGYTRGSAGPSGVTSTAFVQSLDAGIHMTQPWFHSGLPRDKATELVSKHGTVDGVFLVRDSRSSSGSYVITYKCGGKVIHAQVNPILDPLRDRAVYSIDNGVTKFYDLLQLVEFYQLNAGCLPTRLTHYVTFTLQEDTYDKQREFSQSKPGSSH